MSGREATGDLSSAETMLKHREELAFLKERMEARFYEACQVRDECHNRLVAVLPKGFPLELLDSYSDARAKAVIAARELEALGWKP